MPRRRQGESRAVQVGLPGFFIAPDLSALLCPSPMAQDARPKSKMRDPPTVECC